MHASAWPRAASAKRSCMSLIETGEARRKDEIRLWIAAEYADRDDNSLCASAVLETALAIKTVMHHFSWDWRLMKTIYYPQDDILEIRLSDKPIAREVSQDWNVNVSYAQDGSVVELVILDAVKAGFMPFHSALRNRSAHSFAGQLDKCQRSRIGWHSEASHENHDGR
jgi:hypothetical protein